MLIPPVVLASETTLTAEPPAVVTAPFAVTDAAPDWLRLLTVIPPLAPVTAAVLIVVDPVPLLMARMPSATAPVTPPVLVIRRSPLTLVKAFMPRLPSTGPDGLMVTAPAPFCCTRIPSYPPVPCGPPPVIAPVVVTEIAPFPFWLARTPLPLLLALLAVILMPHERWKPIRTQYIQ